MSRHLALLGELLAGDQDAGPRRTPAQESRRWHGGRGRLRQLPVERLPLRHASEEPKNARGPTGRNGEQWVRSLDARRVGAVRRVSEQLEVRPQERDDVGLVLGLGRQSQLLWLFVREHVATEL